MLKLRLRRNLQPGSTVNRLTGRKRLEFARHQVEVFVKAKLIIGLAAVVVLAAVVMTGFAQESAEADTIVTGAVSFVDGDIYVAGVKIAPANAFNPSILQEGGLVIITGVLLPDGTLQAITLEFFDEEDPEVTPEPTPEPTAEPTPELTPEPTAEPTLPPATGCYRPDHPIALSIAATFGVSYDEVMGYHCSGMGFGNIVRAYTLAQASEGEVTAAELLERHKSGEGWGNIRRDSDVPPFKLAPGQVLKRGAAPTAEPTAEVSGQAAPGNGGNPGRGNSGNPGRGNSGDNPGRSNSGGNPGGGNPGKGGGKNK